MTVLAIRIYLGLLNQDFYEDLEYRISHLFNSSDDKNLRCLWCDGVLVPTLREDFIHHEIVKERKLVTQAYFGKDGQDKYELTLKFGEYSFDKFLKGQELTNCIPECLQKENFELDLERKKLIIHLI